VSTHASGPQLAFIRSDDYLIKRSLFLNQRKAGEACGSTLNLAFSSSAFFFIVRFDVLIESVYREAAFLQSGSNWVIPCLTGEAASSGSPQTLSLSLSLSLFLSRWLPVPALILHCRHQKEMTAFRRVCATEERRRKKSATFEHFYHQVTCTSHQHLDRL